MFSQSLGRRYVAALNCQPNLSCEVCPSPQALAVPMESLMCGLCHSPLGALWGPQGFLNLGRVSGGQEGRPWEVVAGGQLAGSRVRTDLGS